MATSRDQVLRRAVIWFPAAWLILSSCAMGRQQARAPEPPPARAQAVDTTGSTGSGRGRVNPVPAVVDSAPSSEALEVLNSIPEPLAEADRVPPPDRGSMPPSSPVPTESDTSGHTEVPIPSPTQALGQKPPSVPGTGSAETPPATPPAESSPPAQAPSQPSAQAPTQPPAEPPRRSPSARDTCWRVQIAASSVRFNADRARAAAESVLMVPMVVVQEGTYFKTRTRDCMDRESADRVKQRAAAAGYPGAFRFPGKP